MRVGFHLLAGDLAQASAQRAGGDEKQRQDDNADQGQAPFEGEHDAQHSRGLDHVGDDADDGVADGILRADHIVVQAAHQLADLGVGEEAQRHALQAGVERHAQIVDHAFADTGVQPALDNANRAAQGGDEQQGRRQPDQAVEIARRDGAVDQVAQDERGEQTQPGGSQDEQQHASDMPAIGF